MSINVLALIVHCANVFMAIALGNLSAAMGWGLCVGYQLHLMGVI